MAGMAIDNGGADAVYQPAIDRAPKQRFLYRPPYQRRAVDGLLSVGGRNGGGGFSGSGAADSVYLLWVDGASETALPLSPYPSKPGGGWLTLGGWPGRRREVFESGVVDAVNIQGIARVPKTAPPLSTAPPKACGRWLSVGGWGKWRRGVLENGRLMRFTRRGSLVS